jgi:hypothetical protein
MEHNRGEHNVSDWIKFYAVRDDVVIYLMLPSRECITNLPSDRQAQRV